MMQHCAIVTPILAAALIFGSTGWAAAVQPTTPRTPSVTKKTTVKLRLGSKATTVSKKVTATIALEPASARTVEIQTRSTTNPWETVAKAKTDTHGRLKTKTTTYRSGRYQVRAVAPATKNRKRAVSKSVSLQSTYPAFGDPPKNTLDPMWPGALRIAKKAAGLVP